MKTIVATLCAAAAVLAGCAELERMDAEARAQQRAQDEAQCTGFGYKMGTDAFADCMMLAQHRREQQQAEARRQAELDRQHSADMDARKAAADAAASARHQAEIQNMMRSSEPPSFTPPMPVTPAGTNCTTTTTAQQSGNAGSSTTTTVCH